VERAFRSLKTMDLKVRPIHHRTADRVRAHILLCMLAYYVEWGAADKAANLGRVLLPSIARFWTDSISAAG
jgi:hypothetical protein